MRACPDCGERLYVYKTYPEDAQARTLRRRQCDSCGRVVLTLERQVLKCYVPIGAGGRLLRDELEL